MLRTQPDIDQSIQRFVQKCLPLSRIARKETLVIIKSTPPPPTRKTKDTPHNIDPPDSTYSQMKAQFNDRARTLGQRTRFYAAHKFHQTHRNTFLKQTDQSLHLEPITKRVSLPPISRS